jgi:putative transposase
MRTARIVYPGYPHHVILRGNNRRRLFSYRSEYRGFVRLVADATREHAVDLHNLCLMSNHVHLIATPDRPDALAKWVKSFAQRYAQIRNQLRDGSGKLFEQRYRSKPILTETYLGRVTAYVELNPLRGGLTQRLIDYSWTTYRLHCGATERSEVPLAAWTPSPWFLGLGGTDWDRVRAFREWIDEYDGQNGAGLTEEHLREFEEADAASSPYTRRLERPNRRRAR